MAEKSLAAVLEKPFRIALHEYPVPEIGPDEGLLRVEMVGICSTDVKIYQGKITTFPLPLIMGHELVGRIEKIGRNAAKMWCLKEGDRVVPEASVSCGVCEGCLTGNYRFCRNALGYGLKVSCDRPPHLWGGYSQYMYLAPGSVLHPISESIPPRKAALINSILANGVQWVSLKGQLRVGGTILIEGMGSLGLGSVVAAREAGAKTVMVSGLAADRDRFDLARRLGADHLINVEEEPLLPTVHRLTEGKGVDLVLDVTGNPASFPLALEAVRNQGTVVLAGLTGGDIKAPIILDRIEQKEIRIQGVRNKGYEATVIAISIAGSDRYPLEEMVAAEYPLSDCAKAIQIAGGEGATRPLKVVLTP